MTLIFCNQRGLILPRPGGTLDTMALIGSMACGDSMVLCKLRRTCREHANRGDLRLVVPFVAANAEDDALSHFLAVLLTSIKPFYKTAQRIVIALGGLYSNKSEIDTPNMLAKP